MDTAWIENLKPGDAVFISPSRMEEHPSAHKVTRLTKKYVCVGECKFSKSHGRLVCSDIWNIRYLMKYSEEEHGKIKEARKISKIQASMSQTDWKAVDTDILLKIFNLLHPEHSTTEDGE